MYTTQLVPYSIGIAAEAKPLGTRDLNVTPIEQLPGLDGDIHFNPETNIVRGVDSSGSPYEIRVTTDTSIVAEWLPLSSNRLTPPDIQPGELIELYRLADSDRYFWRCMGLRDELRRLETVIYTFCGDPNVNNDTLDINNCYFFEVSTHQKTITVGTSKTNGEPFGYTLQINAGEGSVTLTDDINNRLVLNSGASSIKAETSSKSFVHLDNRNVFMQNTDGSKVSLVGGNVNVDAPSRVTLNGGGSVLTLQGGGTTLKTPKFDGGT